MDKTNFCEESKTELRRRMIEERAGQGSGAAVKSSNAICQKLLESPWYKEVKRILVYAAIRGEVDLTVFVEKAWADGKEIFFPKVLGEQMEFFRVDGWEQLEPGTFGVPEPIQSGAGSSQGTAVHADSDVPEPVQSGSGSSLCRDGMTPWGVPEPAHKSTGATQKPVILVPGVVFSEKGARIGYGKGYYDRYLKEHKELFPIGIAYEMQMVPDFDADDFDIPMKKIVTELREVDCDDRIGNPV